MVKARLRDGAEHITIGQVGNKLASGYSNALAILEDQEGMKKHKAENGRQTTRHEMKFAELEMKNAALESRISLLSLTPDDYLSL